MSIFSIWKKEQETPSKPKQDLDSTFFNMKVKQLPPNFAQNVMDLQMKMQFAQSFEIDVVKQLNQLYRLAVQFYIHDDPKKAMHFQRKLTSLFSNPQTLSLMDKQKKKPQQRHYQNLLQKQMHNFNTQSNVLVSQMIEGSQKKAQRTGRLIMDNMSNQQIKLKSRMQNRSKAKTIKRTFMSP